LTSLKGMIRDKPAHEAEIFNCPHGLALKNTISSKGHCYGMKQTEQPL
jgi:hypothetical protein